MTEQIEQDIYTDEEIREMFEMGFFPKIHEFAKRVKEKKFPEKDIEFFQVQLKFQFADLDNPLTYQSISDRIRMVLEPYTKEDLEKVKENAERESGTNE